MSTYEIKCEAGKHVYSFTAAELKEKFGPTRANERMEDPEYPLVVKSCEECLEADEKPRPGGLNYLRARYGVPA